MDIVPDTRWPSLTWRVPRDGGTSYTGLVRASGEQPLRSVNCFASLVILFRW
jgi:hypothetical protein